MGNCIVKSPKHERLNEFNRRYFHKLSRNSMLVYNGKGRKMKSSTEDLWKAETPIMEFTDCEEERTYLESPTSLAATAQESFVLSPRNDELEEELQNTQNQIDDQWKSSHVDGDAWNTRPRGGALELRLAKNRYIQQAAASPMTGAPTLSLLSDHHVPTELSSFAEELKQEFERGMPDGVVWVEVTRPKTVTAIAMSRNDDWHDPNSIPLLFAIGTEDGTISVMEILDEETLNGMRWSNSDHSFEISDDEEDESIASTRKFGSQVELPLVGRIRSIDFSPDGKFMLIGGDGCVAYLVAVVRHVYSHGLKDLKIVRKIDRVDRVYAVRFSLDSKSFSFGGFDSSISFGAVESFASEEQPSLIEVDLAGIVFCLDWGQAFVAVGQSNGFTIVDRDHEMVQHFHRPSSVETLKWNPGGTLLAVGDKQVSIFENHSFETKYEISSLSEDTMHFKYRVNSLCWSPDGSFLAIGGSDGICLVVETQSFALVHEVYRPCSIVGLAWGQQINLNGECRRFLGVGDESCKVALLKAGAESDEAVVGSLEVSSEASTIFSTASDWVLREGVFRDVEDVLEPPRRFQPEGAVIAVAFSRCRKRKASAYLAYVAEDCSLTIVSTRDWKPILEMEFPEPIRSLSFSYSSNYLAIGGDEGILYALSVPTRSIILNKIYDSSIRSIAFSRHDERLVVGLADGTLSFLSPSDEWESVGEMDYSDSPILCQDWSFKEFAIGREDGSVGLFSNEKALMEFFVPVAEFFLNTLPVRSIAFGPGGRHLVFGGDNDFVSLARLRDDQWVLTNRIETNCNSILTTKWSRGGRYMVITGSDQTLKVIDTLSGDDVKEIQAAFSKAFTGTITTIDFSIDGRFVALGSTDCGIKIFNTSNWQVVGPPDEKSEAEASSI